MRATNAHNYNNKLVPEEIIKVYLEGVSNVWMCITLNPKVNVHPTIIITTSKQTVKIKIGWAQVLPMPIHIRFVTASIETNGIQISCI